MVVEKIELSEVCMYVLMCVYVYVIMLVYVLCLHMYVYVHMCYCVLIWLKAYGLGVVVEKIELSKITFYLFIYMCERIYSDIDR